MQCEGCAGTIQSILSREPGVKAASVSFPKGTASIYYDPKETDSAQVVAAIEKAGFTARGAA
jgi:mercuric reductase